MPSYWRTGSGDGGGDRPNDRPSEIPRWTDTPRFTDRPRESDEGTGWPKERPDAKPDTRTDAEKVKDLEAEVRSLRSENTRLTGSYDRSLKELQQKNMELEHSKSELSRSRLDNSRLTDTNSLLVRDNMSLRKKTESASAIDRNASAGDAQDQRTEKSAKHRNWFPTDKMGSLGSATAGVADTYGVMIGKASTKEEAFAVACAGAGIAALAYGRELTDKVNAWRDRRAEKKDADRQ